MSLNEAFQKPSSHFKKAVNHRWRSEEINRSFSMYNDPVINLRTLLYGQSPHENIYPEVRQVEAECSKSFNKMTSALSSTQESLLGRQDAYIEQLENENATLKIELGNIHSIVQEIVDENTRLVQNYQMPPTLLSYLPNPLYDPVDMKGLSDEEKMSGGQNTKARVIHSDQKETSLSSAEKSIGANDMDQMRILIALRKEKDDMIAVIEQLEKNIDDMRTREEAVRIQLKHCIVLVEQAQYEKIQALAERDKIKEEDEILKMQISKIETGYEEKLAAVQNSVSKLYKDKYEEDERDLAETHQKLISTRICLDKVDGEKVDLQHRLHKAEKQLGTFHVDMQEMAEKMQEEITKALTERNIAAQDLAQIKVKWERARHEHQKELLWTKLELREIRKKMEQMEQRHVTTKSDLIRISERNHYLEKKLELTERWAKQEIRVRNETLSTILKSIKMDEEEWGKLLQKHSQRHKEHEQMIGLQICLVNRFKLECQLLEKRVEKIKEQYQASTGELKTENDLLTQKLVDTDQACKQLEILCDEHNTHQLTMKKDIEQQNLYVVQLLARQDKLMKERQLLHEEMDFLWHKFNVALK